eukprot:5286155-Pleurochrysis_carterae.AAC.1
MSSHPERASTHPSPTCATMSVSGQRSFSAAARSAALSIYRAPGNCVCRLDRVTGTHRAGSLQSHTVPRAH